MTVVPARLLSSRLQALASSGFVPTAPEIQERLDNLIALPERGRYTVLDLTAGEGDFFRAFDGPQADLYGIEISADRVERARAQYPRALIIHAPYEECSLPRNKVSLALGNPPYVFQDGERLEYLLVSGRLTPSLQSGGLLFLLLPVRSAWRPEIINHLIKHYEDIRVWMTPQFRHTQILVTARKRAHPFKTIEPVLGEKHRLEQWIYDSDLEQSSVSPWRSGSPPPELPTEPVSNPYQVPQASGPLSIRVLHPDESLLLHYLGETGVDRTEAWELATTWSPDVKLERPLVAIEGEAHVAACAMLDMFAGEVFTDEAGNSCTFLAYLSKEWIKVEPTLDEIKDRVIRIQQEQDLLQLSVLNLSTGKFAHYQRDDVYEFLRPWMPTMRARIQERYPPLYDGKPAKWLVEATALVGLDRALKGSSLPGLVREQLEAVWAMWYALCVQGWVGLAAEQGVGKTRMHLALMAAMAHAWKHSDILFGKHPPRWITQLKRSWARNPLVQDTQPKALPCMVSTPCNVVPVWEEEIAVAWPEAEILVIDDHTDIRLLFDRCAKSSAPAVIALLSQSQTRATRRHWVPAVIEKRTTRRVLDLSDAAYEAGGVPEVADDGTLLCYRNPETDEPMFTTKDISHFFCPDCGQMLLGCPRKNKKKEQAAGLAEELGEEGEQKEDQGTAVPGEEGEMMELGEAELAKEIFATLLADKDRLIPVTSRAYFGFKPRWCSCGSPLWTDARSDADQRKRPALSFAQWSQVMGVWKASCLGSPQGMDLDLAGSITRSGRPAVRLTELPEKRQEGPACLIVPQLIDSSHAEPLKIDGVLIGYRLVSGEEVTLIYNVKTRRRVGCVTETGQLLTQRYSFTDPPADSFSPPAYLKLFFPGCLAYVEVDESHNIRNQNTDIGEATRAAQDAAQIFGHGTGTPYGGLLRGFFYGQARLNFHFWESLGYGWKDCGKACGRYGFSRIVTRLVENPALRGTGRDQDTEVDSVQSTPGMAVTLIPRLFSNYIDLSLKKLGAHLPPRIEIPVLVPMEDPDIEEQKKRIDSERAEAERKAQEANNDYQLLSTPSALPTEGEKAIEAEVDNLAEEEIATRISRTRWEEAQASLALIRQAHTQQSAWMKARDLADAYQRVEKDLAELATETDAARLAQQWLTRLWLALPFSHDPHYTVSEKVRSEWGDIEDEHVLYRMPQMEEQHLYPMERKLQEIVAREVAAGRPTAVAFLQNGKRETASRLASVLKDFHPWILTNDIKAQDRERAIKNAAAAGYLLFLIPYERTLEGLNLQCIVNGIWYELPDRLFHLEQWQRRFWRLGQDQEVHLYFLAYTGSVAFYMLYRLGLMTAALSLFVGKVPENALAKFVGAHRSALARLSAAIALGDASEEETAQFTQLMSEQIFAAFEKRNADYRALTSVSMTEKNDDIQCWIREARRSRLPSLPAAQVLPVPREVLAEHPWDAWRQIEQELRRELRQQRAQAAKEKAQLRRQMRRDGQLPPPRPRVPRVRRKRTAQVLQLPLW